MIRNILHQQQEERDILLQQAYINRIESGDFFRRYLTQYY